MKEKWKWIPGYKGYYKASTLGRVKTVNKWVQGKCKSSRFLKGKILKPRSCSRGHLSLTLSKKGKTKFVYVHQLILLTFVGPCPSGMECRHFPDRDPTNNRIDNLSYATPLVNMHDRVFHGTLAKGKRNGKFKISDDSINRMRRFYKKKGYTKKRLAKIFNCSLTYVCSILGNKVRKVIT